MSTTTAAPFTCMAPFTARSSTVAIEDFTAGTFHVPRHETPSGVADGDFDVELRGRLYLRNDSAQRRPLVIIGHGFWYPPDDVHSYQGYDWLGEHLAHHGVAVCSLDLSQVNRETEPATQQMSRGEVILAMIECLLVLPVFGERIDPDRVGLVGHSMCGEGVVAAQVLNGQRGRRFGIRGIVSLAPTNWRPDLASTNAAYLQLHGSQDYLLGGPSEVTGPEARFGGFRLYDRAWRPRTHVFIGGAGHSYWNTVWTTSANNPDLQRPPDLSPDRQREVGRGFLRAFFFDSLFDRTVYRNYLNGVVPPPEVGAVDVRLQHQSAAVHVIDDFGDADGQLGSPQEDPHDKARNRRGQPVRVTGSGLDRWEDVEHSSLERSLHDTRGVDIAWHAPDVVYETGLGSLTARSSDVLSLRVAQHFVESDDEPDTIHPDETWNPAGRSIDFLVELDDGRERAIVRLGGGNDVPYPFPHLGPYSTFRTVRLRLDAFVAANPALDLGSLETLRLRFALEQTGRLLIDDIEIDRAPLPTPVSVGEGVVTSLRVHREVGYGPPDDHIRVHVIVRLDADPETGLGFPLGGDGAASEVHDAWLELLRNAFTSRERVRIEYELTGAHNQLVTNIDLVT